MDKAAHSSNLHTSEYKTENPTECNKSTRNYNLDTLWTNNPTAKRSGDKCILFLQNCISGCVTAIFPSFFFFSPVSVRDLELIVSRNVFIGPGTSLVSFSRLKSFGYGQNLSVPSVSSACSSSHRDSMTNFATAPIPDFEVSTAIMFSRRYLS